MAGAEFRLRLVFRLRRGAGERLRHDGAWWRRVWVRSESSTTRPGGFWRVLEAAWARVFLLSRRGVFLAALLPTSIGLNAPILLRPRAHNHNITPQQTTTHSCALHRGERRRLTQKAPTPRRPSLVFLLPLSAVVSRPAGLERAARAQPLNPARVRALFAHPSLAEHRESALFAKRARFCFRTRSRAAARRRLARRRRRRPAPPAIVPCRRCKRKKNICAFAQGCEPTEIQYGLALPLLGGGSDVNQTELFKSDGLCKGAYVFFCLFFVSERGRAGGDETALRWFLVGACDASKICHIMVICA